MTAEAGRDWRIEEEDPLDALLEEDAGMSVEERVARDEAAVDDEAEEPDEEAPESEDTGAERILSWAEDTAHAAASAEATWRAQWSEAERMLPGYVEPRAEPETAIERAAVELSRMDDRERDSLLQSMRDANARLAASYKAGQPGFDSEGDPVEPPFDPSTLTDPKDWEAFVKAVSSGGADPRYTPANHTRDSWSRAIDSALGKR